MKLTPVWTALSCAALLSLAACSSDDDPVVPPEPPVTPEPGTPPAPAPQVLFEESFDGPAAAGLPDGWRLVTGEQQAVSRANGSLIIDSTAEEWTSTVVALPSALESRGNYRVDVQFTIESARADSRWASVMYRTSPSANLEPYFQMAIRKNAAAENGTELAWRENGQWSVPYKAAFTEAIDPAKTYTATIVAHDGRAQQFLNGQLLHDGELGDKRLTGGLGFQASGARMRVDHVVVREQTEPLPDLGMDVYTAPEPTTGAVIAPTLVGTYASNAANAAGASNLMLNLDASLNLNSASGESAGTLAQFLDRGDAHAVPVLRIRDAATVQALVPFVAERRLVDITLVSDSEALLAQAREQLPRLRTALDASARTIGTQQSDLLALVQETNRSGSKIVIVPPALQTREAVAYLQRMLITVWAGNLADNAPAARAAVVATGVNGIVTTNVAGYAELLSRLPAGTLVRKPLVVGHRGVPSLVDENTLEGAQRAFELGADVIESDIYISTDGEIVVMHDGTVDRTTTSKGSIESMSLAQIQALSTKGGLRVPTLAQFFDAFKGKPVTHFVEIKSSKPGIVDALKTLIERHGVQNQVAVISFSRDQLLRMREVMPEVSTGFLTGVPTGFATASTLRQILDGTQAMSSTFNPSYQGLNRELLEAAKHRGTTFWPWTYRDEAVGRAAYLTGLNGLTTDYAQWFSDYPVQLDVPAQAVANAGMLSVPVTVRSQVGESSALMAERFVVVEASAPYTTDAEGRVAFSGPGTATVMAVHSHPSGAGSYRLVSAPIGVTVR